MSLFLDRDELERLTGKVRHSAQARALVSMGIDHKVRPDGAPLVLRSDLLSTGKRNTLKSREPNWSALAEAPKA